MKCSTCKDWEQVEVIRGKCKGKFTEMDTECLMRHLFWLVNSSQSFGQSLGKKVEKIIDKEMKEIDEGDAWKKEGD